MASPAQINANRLNAMKSTGPRTDDGKAASRLNALRHGADAELSVIPGEDPAGLAELSHDYHRHYRPAGPEETFLVETLVQSEWLRRRLSRIETEMTNHLLAEMEPCANPLGVLYCSTTPGARALERIRRHYEAADRAWFRALHRLEKLRRQAAEDLFLGLPPIPAAAPEPDEVDDLPDSAAQIGFVPPIPRPGPSLAEIAARSSAADPRLALRL